MRRSFLARIPEGSERGKLPHTFVGLPSPAVHSHIRTRSILNQRSGTAVHYLPARTPSTMGPLRGAHAGLQNFKHGIGELEESSAESAAAEGERAEELDEGMDAAEEFKAESADNITLEVEVCTVQ
jgi:hypothetical protein